MNTMAQRSPLALSVLALLVEAPMHPYMIQRLVKERGKDRVIYVGQRASIYKTIERLHRDGLIAIRGSKREAQRPERTIYEATAEGRKVVVQWMREMLASPRPEFPEFPAAVAYLPLLTPEDALRQLELRQLRLTEVLAKQKADLAAAPQGLPRLFLMEEEFLRAVTSAELTWVNSIVEDLRSGRVTWSAEWLTEMAAKFSPTSEEPSKKRGKR